MKCTNCFKEIPNESSFCRHCGAPVKIRGEVENVENSSTRRCNNCGALIKGGFAFCHQCGSPLEDVMIENDKSKNYGKKKKKVIKIIAIIVVLLIFVVLVGVGIYIYGRNRTDSINGDSNETVIEERVSETTGQNEETETSSETSIPQDTSGELPDHTEKQNETINVQDNPNTESEIDTITEETSVGDYVYYGSYEQNNNSEDGNEQIKWLVLDEEDGRYLLITAEAIDCRCYNEVWKETAWKNCTLRDWLNSSFLRDAFTENQIDHISYSEHIDEEGNYAKDQVFILNTIELEEYFDSDEQRATGATPYAEAQGAYVYNNRNCWWWVSDAGEDPHYARYVNCEGVILEYGMLVFNNAFGIRPAIWVQK